MRDLASATRALKIYKEAINSADTWSDYDQGMHNGLELALSLLEGRPVFYKDKDGMNRPEDIENHPEYFL